MNTDEVTFWSDEPDLWSIQWMQVNADGTHIPFQYDDMTLEELTEFLGTLGFAPKTAFQSCPVCGGNQGYDCDH